jgi:tetratricopeptide (TPR) repeat protein
MKSLSIVTFLILTCQICFGQASNKIDSLKAVIKSEIADTSKVWVYYELSGSPIPADEQLKYLQEGLTLAKKLNFVKGITLGTWQLAFKNNVLGNWAKGLEIALEGYNEALRTKNKADELSFMNMIALSYCKQRDYKTTLQWTKQSIEKLNNGYPAIGNNEWAAYMQTATVYAYLNQPDSAIISADKSIASAIQNKSPATLLGYSYEYKGDAYVKKRNFNLAFKNYTLALEYLIEDPFSVQEVQRQIAKMYMEMNDKPNAEKYALLAYE